MRGSAGAQRLWDEVVSQLTDPEEQFLAEEFGDEYLDYQGRVRRYL